MQIIRQTYSTLTRWLQPAEKQTPFALTPRHRKRFLVNQTHKILYCPIEKNSCTFFKRLLLLQSPFADLFLASELDPHNFLKQTGLMRPETVDPFIHDDYLRFVVVREPIGRIVSAYMNKFVRSRRYKVALKLTESYRQQMGQPYDEGQLLTFSEFVRHISQQNDANMDVHWRPQSDFVRNEIDLFQYKVTLEKIPAFTAVLSRRMGIELDASKTANQNHYGSYSNDLDLHLTAPEDLRKLEYVPDTKSLVTPELMEILNSRYSKDIELYHACAQSDWPASSLEASSRESKTTDQS